MIETMGRGVLDHPPEPVIGLAGGETRWRVKTVVCVERPRVLASRIHVHEIP